MRTDRIWEHEINGIRELGLSGHTLKQIGDIYGVTGQYIKKLIKKYKIFDDGVVYGVRVRAEKKRLARFLKYGYKENTELYKAKRNKFTLKKSFAKRNGIEFNINFGELEFPESCPILNIKLDYFATGYPKDNSPSFDRIDNTLGYVTGNVYVISNRANTLKNSATIDEVEAILNYMRYKTP